ncbi:MAG: 3-oxoacyl-ACP reductase FabG [Chloroflexota bacterium]|nr:3-oxoacyl-ACP reductase FabG [Chloroflexota bacterium]
MTALSGRAALVTGAGTGIGQAIAIELAQQGARVAVHYGGSAAGPGETVARIEALGGDGFTVQGDLRVVAECERVVDEAVERWGGLDILVNNAGVTRAQPLAETTEALFDEMFDLNVKGYFFCARRAAPALERSGNGVIINISSVHGRRGAPNHVAYAATKGAVTGLTQTLAIELAPRGIRVNAIGPGVIEVPRYFDRPGYTREAMASRIPLGRVGLPPDIATVVAFLASDDAGYLTGQVIYVDGGLTTRMGSL